MKQLMAALAAIVAFGGLVGAPVARASQDPAATCTNYPTYGTQLRSPYLPDEAEAALSATWDAREQPGDAQFSYLVYVPESVPEGPVPLVVTVHGLLGSAKQHISQTDWQSVADANGFVLVAPNGHRRWDHDYDSVDARFVRDVIADVRIQNCVDAYRIYVTGHSNGGFMTHRAACEFGDVIAAGASYAAGDIAGAGECPASGTRPDGSQIPGWERVPLGMWHGTDDGVIAYAAGRRGLRKWLERHDCDTVATTSLDAFGSTEQYGNCLEGVSITFRTLNGHGHAWPDGCGGQNSGTGGSVSCEPEPGTGPWPSARNLADELWSFLSQHRRDAPAVEQEVSAMRVPTPPSTALVTGTTTEGVESGIDSVATFERTEDISVTPGRLRTELVLRVSYDGDAAGLGATHPVCPTSNAGSGTQSMPDRTVTVSAEDIHGRAVSAEIQTEPFVRVTSDGTTEHLESVIVALDGEFDARNTVLRASYAGDVVKFWWGCGGPPARYKETRRPMASQA